MLQRLGAGSRGPDLLHPPFGACDHRLGKNVVERRARDLLPIRANHRRAGGERPVAACFILGPDAAVQQRDSAVGLRLQQHRRKLPRRFKGKAPLTQRLGRLFAEDFQIRRRHRGGGGRHDLGQFKVIRHGDRKVRQTAKAATVDLRARQPFRRSAFADETGVDVAHVKNGVEGAADLAGLPGEFADPVEGHALRGLSA